MSTLCDEEEYFWTNSTTVNSPQFTAVMKDLDPCPTKNFHPTKPKFPQTPVIRITLAAEGHAEFGDVPDGSLTDETPASSSASLENSDHIEAEARCAGTEEEDSIRYSIGVARSTKDGTADKINGDSQAVGGGVMNGEIVQRRSASNTEDTSPEARTSPKSSSPKLRRGEIKTNRLEDSANRVKASSPALRRRSAGQLGEKPRVSPSTRRKSFSAINQNTGDPISESDSCQTTLGLASNRKQSTSQIPFTESNGALIQQVKRADKIDLSFQVPKNDNVVLCSERGESASHTADFGEQDSNHGNDRSPLPRRKTISVVGRDDVNIGEGEERETGYLRQRNASFPGTGAILRRRSTVEEPVLARQCGKTSLSPPRARKSHYSEIEKGATNSTPGKPRGPTRRVTLASTAPLLQAGQSKLSRSCSDLQQLLADEEMQSPPSARVRPCSTWVTSGSSTPHPPPGSPILPRMERRIYLTAANNTHISQKSKSWDDLKEATMLILKEASRDDGIPKEALPQISMEEVLRSWKTSSKHYNMISSVINPRPQSSASVDFKEVKDCRYIRKSPY